MIRLVFLSSRYDSNDEQLFHCIQRAQNKSIWCVWFCRFFFVVGLEQKELSIWWDGKKVLLDFHWSSFRTCYQIYLGFLNSKLIYLFYISSFIFKTLCLIYEKRNLTEKCHLLQSKYPTKPFKVWIVQTHAITRQRI